ncbi:hypothetical protein ACWC10_25955 [Streptomyces sp. NPDC001595]|uniref:hypothetical protein n=1 Tax=Streptomyces sp. NPDC001532 TaxID=3154520 RepID=UPI003325763E
MSLAVVSSQVLLAEGGRPELPPWGEVVLLIVWAVLFVFIVLRLRARRRGR